GSGPVFCAGADLKEQRAAPGAAPTLFPQILEQIWDSDKPVICRVNGTARAGGIGLIAACDIAIAPAPATFAFTEVRVGAAPAIIAVTCLRRMQPRAGYEYFLTGETFGAERAAAIGLLTRAVPQDDLDAETARYVNLLLRGAPGAVGATKAILREVPGLPVAEGGPIDVLTGDWLAELTMLLLAKSRDRGGPGYARTFLSQLEQVLGTCLERGTKIVSNAGGLDPAGCAEAVRELARRAGLAPKVAHIEGDDL